MIVAVSSRESMGATSYTRAGVRRDEVLRAPVKMTSVRTTIKVAGSRLRHSMKYSGRSMILVL